MNRSLKHIVFTITMAAGLALCLNATAAVDSGEEHPFGQRSIFSDRATQDRIKPSGNLCIQGEDCAGVAAEVAAAEEIFDPEQVYNAKCMGCHATGAAGAPKLGDVSAWSARLEKGMDQLVENAVNGINGMPSKGLCMECSDEDIKAIVQYILDNSK